MKTRVGHRLNYAAAALVLIGAIATNRAMAAGAVQSFLFPVTLYAADGSRTGLFLTKRNAPSPADVAVLGYWPNKKLLLVQLQPNDPNTTFISYRAVKMVNQPLWETRMRATGELVCSNQMAFNPGWGGGGNPNAVTLGSKGFKSPC